MKLLQSPVHRVHSCASRGDDGDSNRGLDEGLQALLGFSAHEADALASACLRLHPLDHLRAAIMPGTDAVRNASPALHACAAVLVLLAATFLAVYKPRGVTRYGWRKQHELRASARE